MELGKYREPDVESLERWTVVEADTDGVVIESVALDAEGNPDGEPSRQPATWTQLRDHASFPAEHAQRSTVTRETELGVLEGWLYEVRDPGSGSVTEFFFASSMPGAPVEMRTTLNGEVVQLLEQIERGPAGQN